MLQILFPALLAAAALMQGCKEKDKPSSGQETKIEDLLNPPKVPPRPAVEGPCPQGEVLPNEVSFRAAHPNRQDLDRLKQFLAGEKAPVSAENPKLIHLLRPIFSAPEFQLQNLKLLSEKMNQAPYQDNKFSVYAYSFEQSLAWYRAETVELLLGSMGVQASRMQSAGLGKLCDEGARQDSTAWQRVDVLVQ